MPNRIIILGIRFPVISTLCCILIMYCNNSEAQVSENTLESVANQPGVEGSPQIISGNNPLYIYGDYDIPTIYVVNSDSDTVTVIDTANNTAYRNLRVGISPVHIYGDPLPNDTSQDTLYVANSGSGSVSVINATTDTVNPKPIFVGISPVHIFGDLSASDTIYVANSGSGSVSVINATTDTVKKEIPVGVNPVYIFGDPFLEDIYVANSDSGGVSVINGKTNEAVAGVKFNVSPFGGGDIHCNINNNDLEAPINRFLYVPSGTKCIAKPSKGFEFSSWGEILEGNSTRTINETSGSLSWSALLDTFNIKSDDPASSLTVNRFGNFTSHFRTLPTAIPSEYLIPLYGIIASTVIGFSIPSIINWRKSKKQTSLD